MKKPPVLSISDLYKKGDDHYLKHLSIDCVIFGFHENELKVLLLQWRENKRWCLPGGFILKNEHVDDAAIRILKMRTGLEKIYLRQFYAFGDPARDRRKHVFKPPAGSSNSWMMGRFITIGYWALVEFSQVVPSPDEFSSSCTWVDVKKIPELILDHNEIVEKALESLQHHLNDYPIGKDLLSEKFTMPELQKLYETILGKNIDRRNFQKKILSLGILDRLKELKTGGAHKSPFLYRFNKKKYQAALKQGIKFGL
jgi:8-oxo-dGTP diphosphatase